MTKPLTPAAARVARAERIAAAALALLAAAVLLEQGPTVEDATPALTRSLIRTLRHAEKHTTRPALIHCMIDAVNKA